MAIVLCTRSHVDSLICASPRSIEVGTPGGALSRWLHTRQLIARRRSTATPGGRPRKTGRARQLVSSLGRATRGHVLGFRPRPILQASPLVQMKRKTATPGPAAAAHPTPPPPGPRGGLGPHQQQPGDISAQPQEAVHDVTPTPGQGPGRWPWRNAPWRAWQHSSPPWTRGKAIPIASTGMPWPALPIKQEKRFG